MTAFNLSLNDEQYDKIRIVQNKKNFEKKQQAVRFILDSFPYDLIEKIERFIIESDNNLSYNKLFKMALGEYIGKKER
jgi:hypothetical protein